MDEFGAAFIVFLFCTGIGFAGAGIEGAVLAGECENFGHMTIGSTRFECKLAPLPEKQP